MIRLIVIAILFFVEVEGSQNVYVGPEFYHVKRTREGGSKQSAFMYGGHLLYERVATNAFYWAIDGYYTTGHADGKTSSGKKTKSTLTDAEIEGRFGFTLSVPYLNCLTATPYAAYGHFYGTNKFHKPSPISCEFIDKYNYGAGGLILTYQYNNFWLFGFDFSAMYMLTGIDKIKNDPEYDKVKLEIESMWQYELDFPIQLTTCFKDHRYDIRLVPFYRFRHFGGKPNYPFDFFETKYQIYGLQCLVRIGF